MALRKVGSSTKSERGELETSIYNEKTDCPVPYISCVCKNFELPCKVDGDEPGIRMRCTNTRCPLVKLLLHQKCAEQLEEKLLKVLSNLGSARGWTDTQLRANLWEKKGLTLIAKLVRCHCGQGLMSRDVEFYKKQNLDCSKMVQQQTEQRKKKSHKKKLPSLNFNSTAPVAAELTQFDFVATSKRRASYGAHSSSSLLLIHTLSDSDESEHAGEQRRLRRTTSPAPTKSKLIVEKPKPVSADRMKPAQKQAPQPLTPKKPSLKKQTEAKRLPQLSQTLQKDSPIEGGDVKNEVNNNNDVKQSFDTETKILDVPKASEPCKVSQSESTREERQQQGYTLFDSSGFFLGELIMAEAHLPRILVPFPHSA